MPRTVKGKCADLNTTENTTIANQTKSANAILDDFEAEKKNIVNSLSDSRDNYINIVENAFLMVKMNLSSSLQTNLYEYIDMDSNPKTEKPEKKPEISSKIHTITANKTNKQTKASKSQKRVIASNKKNDLKFKTPLTRAPLSTSVTPKVNMNEPMSMMRRPKQGEVALSLTGSPLMVSSISRDNMATVSVPLPNGNILSILPRHGASMNVSLNVQTKKELLYLKGNIEGLLKSGYKK